MLNDIEDIYLNQRVTGSITRFFHMVRKLSLSIHDPEARKVVGKLLLEHVKITQEKIRCPEKMTYVIRNIKYAYIKDMMIADVPMNYERKLRPHEIEDYWTPFEGKDYESN